ncbi:MAG: tryptophan synthase subunit alpha [Deinococcota bacterium]
MSRIDDAFAKAKAEERAAFIPYLTAGFPNEATFLQQARAILEVADVLEVGMPYSDPLGDGPTIQKSGEAALRAGMTMDKTLELISQLREQSHKAIVMMTYYNPIYVRGEEQFVHDLKQAGADGVILPDLPPDEGESMIAAARDAELDTVFLVAPTSTEARLKRVTQDCCGFIYAVSVTGVTGARSSLPADVPALVRRTKAVSNLPVAVGFGVSSGDTARPIAQVADGVVVGSALIKRLANGEDVMPLAKDIVGACHKQTAVVS